MGVIQQFYDAQIVLLLHNNSLTFMIAAEKI